MADLNPIRALLYALDRKAAISVVAATTEFRAGFDLEKIARYVEEIPDLPMDVVLKVINTFRQGCRDEQAFVEPDAQAAEQKWEGLSFEVARVFSAGKLLTIEGALVHMGATGRTLKQGLRLCYVKWQAFRGEINFEDLLVMSLLKVSEPKLFKIVADHVSVFRNEPDKADEALGKLYEAEHLNDIEREVLDLVRKEVFQPKQGRIKLQGLVHEEYWLRFLQEPDLEERQLDQPILRAIVDNDEQRLLEIIQDEEKEEAFGPSRSGKLSNFGALLPVDRAVSLYRRLVTELRDKRWLQDIAPGLIAMVQLLEKKKLAGELEHPVDLVKEGLDISVPSNLLLAADLDRLFFGPDVGFVNEGEKVEIEKYLHLLLRQSFSSHPDKLIHALEGGRSAELLWLCRGVNRIRRNDLSMNHFDNWAEFSEVILEAARKDPKVMLPQLAWFVVDQRQFAPWNGQRTAEFDFKNSYAEKFFGSTQKVLDVLVGLDPKDWEQPQVQALFRARDSI